MRYGRSGYRKYRNKTILVEGIPFDSIKEGRRFAQLRLLQQNKEITDLKLQQVFELQEGFRDNLKRWHRPITYVADFVYRDKKYDWRLVVEDTKGFKTDVFKLKRKLLIKKYPEVVFIET